MAPLLGSGMQLSAHIHRLPRLRMGKATQPDLHMLSVQAYGQFCLYETHILQCGLVLMESLSMHTVKEKTLYVCAYGNTHQLITVLA
jgi:hypothetical protein